MLDYTKKSARLKVKSLKSLLEKPNQEFWQQILAEDSQIICELNEFLQSFPRGGDVASPSSEAATTTTMTARRTARDLHRLNFLLVLRLASYKKCRDCFVSKRQFVQCWNRLGAASGNTSPLFDVAQLMDIARLYTPAQTDTHTHTKPHKLCHQLIESVISMDPPRFASDLELSVDAFSRAASKLVLDLGVSSCPPELSVSASPLTHTSASSISPVTSMCVDKLADVLDFLLDAAFSWKQLLCVGRTSPRLAPLLPIKCFELRLHFRWAALFDSVMPVLRDHIASLFGDDDADQQQQQEKFLVQLCVFSHVVVSGVFCPLVAHSLNDVISSGGGLDASNAHVVAQLIETLFELVHNYRFFVEALECVQPIRSQIAVMREAMRQLEHSDAITFNYLGELLSKLESEFDDAQRSLDFSSNLFVTPQSSQQPTTSTHTSSSSSQQNENDDFARNVLEVFPEMRREEIASWRASHPASATWQQLIDEKIGAQDDATLPSSQQQHQHHNNHRKSANKDDDDWRKLPELSALDKERILAMQYEEEADEPSEEAAEKHNEKHENVLIRSLSNEYNDEYDDSYGGFNFKLRSAANEEFSSSSSGEEGERGAVRRPPNKGRNSSPHSVSHSAADQQNATANSRRFSGAAQAGHGRGAHMATRGSHTHTNSHTNTQHNFAQQQQQWQNHSMTSAAGTANQFHASGGGATEMPSNQNRQQQQHGAPPFRGGFGFGGRGGERGGRGRGWRGGHRGSRR